jgi:hypothetical protein
VKKAFRDFEKLDPEQDAEECEALVQQTCAELSVHSKLEEECLYPAIHDAIKEPDLIDEAEIEHQTTDAMVERLQQMSSDEEKYAATFKVLGEYVNHHIKEEEGEIFPQLSRAKLDFDGLLEQMQTRRAELMAELMPEGVAEEEAEPASSTAKPRSGARATRMSDAARPQASDSDDEE